MAGWFTSRVNASVAQAAPVAEPLGIGETVSALGRTAGGILDQKRQADVQVSRIDLAIAEREKAAKQDAANSALAVKLAQGEGEYSRWVIDHQNDADFDKLAPAKVDADIAALRGELGDDPHLLNHWNPLLAQTAEARKTAAYNHVAAIRAKASASATDDLVTTSNNNAANAPDRTAEFADTVSSAIMGNSTIPAALRPAAAKAAAGQVWTSGLSAAIRKGGYEAVAKELDAGTYNEMLPDEAISALRRQIDAERGAAGVAARAAEAEQQKAAREAIAQVAGKIKHGDPVSIGTINSVLANAKAAKLPDSELQDAGYLAENMVHVQNAKALDTGTLETRIGALEARRSAGGQSQLKPEEGRMLDAFKDELNARDVKDGESISGLWRQGPAGQAEALGRLGQMPLEQRERVTAKMGQEPLAITAALRPAVQQQALAGMQVRAARGKDYLPPAMPHEQPMDKVRKEFDAIVGGPVKNGLAGQYGAMIETAMNIYVGAQSMHGATGGWERDGFEKAVKIAFGASRRADGTWQGGLGTVRGRKVELPDRWNEAEFDTRVSRFDFGGSGAVYGNGNPASNADVTAHYQPVFNHQDPDGTTFYRFEDARGTALWDRRAKRVFLLPFANPGAR